MPLAIYLLWLPHMLPPRKWMQVYMLGLTALVIYIKPLAFTDALCGLGIGISVGLLYLPLSFRIVNFGLKVETDPPEPNWRTIPAIRWEQLTLRIAYVSAIVFCEEVLWRWALLGLSPLFWVLGGILFVVIHFLHEDTIVLVNLIEMSLFTIITMMTFAYTNNIWLCMGFHFARNFTLSLLRHG